MHEEKSRFYWYQFSDYTLVWPTIYKKAAGCRRFFYKDIAQQAGLNRRSGSGKTVGNNTHSYCAGDKMIFFLTTRGKGW